MTQQIRSGTSWTQQTVTINQINTDLRDAMLYIDLSNNVVRRSR